MARGSYHDDEKEDEGMRRAGLAMLAVWRTVSV